MNRTFPTPALRTLSLALLTLAMATGALAAESHERWIECPARVTHSIDSISLRWSNVPSGWNLSSVPTSPRYLYGNYPVIGAEMSTSHKLVCNYGVPFINDHGERVVNLGYILERIEQNRPSGFTCSEDSSVESIGFYCYRNFIWGGGWGR